MSRKFFLQSFGISFVFAALTVSAAFAQTTEFTYQGKLQNSFAPANGNYDFEFLLFNAVSGGTQIGATIPLNSVLVADGTFSVKLDFLAQFPGGSRFLEIHVRQTGIGAFTPLLPRQQVNSSPYSIKTLSADIAANATNATQLGGVDSSLFVQHDAGGNVSIGGGLNVAGTLTQNIVNATTQYNLGGQRILGTGAGGSSFFAGIGAGQSNTGGTFNTFIGTIAGQSNITGSGNSFFGFNAGLLNTTGDSNSFFGDGAGKANVVGSTNAFFGRLAGFTNVASGNSFFGAYAGLNSTTGGGNTFAGFNSGGGSCAFPPCAVALTGGNNSFFGSYAGLGTTTGNGNAFFGAGAGQQNTTGNQNVFSGEYSGFSNTTGVANVFLGNQAGVSNMVGGFNTIVGRFAGFSNNADANAFFGAGAGEQNTTGTNNTFVGTSVGAANITGSGNSFFGRDAGRNNTADNNDFFGLNAGKANTTGFDNSFFGRGAGTSNQTGSSNNFFGGLAGGFNVSGSNNAIFGAGAGYQSNASFNAMFGTLAGFANTSGASNSFFGYYAGNGNSTGANNTFVGSSSGVANAIGSNNTLVGALTDVATNNLTNATAIGANVVVSQSNSVILGNNANVGIGTSTPNSKLTVAGLIETTTGGVKFPDGTTQTTAAAASGVTSLNGLTNSVILVGSSSVSITPSGNTLTFTSTGGNSILNQTSQQAGANFNIAGTGTADIFKATTQYNVGAQRVLGTPGQNNLFVGKGAGPITPSFSNDIIENNFFGTNSGLNNLECCNAFFGNYSGESNTTGSGNTFLGYQAGRRNTLGSNNTFVGQNVGNSFSQTGDGNTAVGNAASAIGLNNTAIGFGANAGGGGIVFATAIGAQASAVTSNTIVIGKVAFGPYPTDNVVIPGNLTVSGTFSSPSDARLKTGITKIQYGLNEVLRLRPVTWEWKNDSLNATRLGLIAQEVLPVLPELIVKGTDKDGMLSMNYMGLIPVLVKGIQEQQAQIEAQQKQIEDQNTINKKQQADLVALKALVCLHHRNAAVCKPRN